VVGGAVQQPVGADEARLEAWRGLAGGKSPTSCHYGARWQAAEQAVEPTKRGRGESSISKTSE
jgi:hypothetical protein